jgi:F0F1-type ATP synthase membrane subunit c/vacuolar-type H+-ATPase subunit K
VSQLKNRPPWRIIGAMVAEGLFIVGLVVAILAATAH